MRVRYLYKSIKSSMADCIVLEGEGNNSGNIEIKENIEVVGRSTIEVSIPKGYNIDSNALITSTYQEVIAKALDSAYKSLGIPLIGTSIIKREESYNALLRVLELYNNTNTDLKLDVYLKDEINSKKLLCCKALTGSERYANASSMVLPNLDSLKGSVELNRIFNLANPADMLISEYRINNPMEFIDSFMEENKIKKSYLFNNGFDKDRCSRARIGRRALSKKEIFKASIVLGFNITNLLQILSYAGLSFNPNDSLDIWMHDYYLNNRLCHNMAEFIDRYYDDPVLDELFNE